MIISHERRFIFIKSMKSASSSSESFFLNLLEQTSGPFKEEYDTRVSNKLIHSFGSRYVRHRLGDEMMPHAKPEEIYSILGDSFHGDYTKVVNIRNPYDQTVSLFWWWLWYREKDNYERAKKADLRELKFMFLEFLKKRPNLLRLARLREFATINGVSFPAHYIRYESLEQDLKSTARQLGLGQLTEIPQFKADIRGQKIHYSRYYSPRARLIVYRMNRWELQRFGYRFERL